MQKWEYMVIRSYGGVVMLVNGQEVGSMVGTQPMGDMLYDYLNRVGEEGWNVVGMGGVREGSEIILKRSLDEIEEEQEE